MTTLNAAAVDELRLRLRGGVYEPGGPEYTDTCTLFNGMIERRPRLVAACAAPDDVIAAIGFASEHQFEIAIRAGGHSVAGTCLCDDGLVIDLRPMDDIDVDPNRRVARVGAGATWARVDRATQEHGLATTGGRVSTTGVAGLTLGGGSGWLERSHGLACDNLLAVELVTGDGRLVRASEQEHAELFWGLRGGGGNFGVATAFEFRLHPVGPDVFAGLVLHPADRGREVMALFRDVMRDAPAELSLACAYITGPDESELPPEVRGQPAVVIVGMYAGDIDDGEDALRSVREFGPPALDLFEPMPYCEFQRMIDDPPGYRNYWTAEHLLDLPDEAIDALARRSAQLPAGPSQLLVIAWGGAVAQTPGRASPLGGRDAMFVVHPFVVWTEPSEDEQMIALGRSYRQDLAPWATGATYLNFLGPEGADRVRAGFKPGSYERLARLKAAWDPHNVFHANHNIRPPADAAA